LWGRPDDCYFGPNNGARLNAVNQFQATISYISNLIRLLTGTRMTIFKLSIAAFAALIAGAWAESAKADYPSAGAGPGAPLISVARRIG
jgi:hypothetical protein